MGLTISGGSFSGSTVDLSSPGPIGATTPSTGAFTTLTSSANVASSATLADFIVNGSSGLRVLRRSDGAGPQLLLNGVLTVTSDTLTTGNNNAYKVSTHAFSDSNGALLTLQGDSGGGVRLIPRNHILEVRNAANAQTLRIYNAYTDASNYERGVFDWSSTANTLTIGAQAAGTGTARAVALQGNTLTLYPATSASTGRLQLTTAATTANANVLFGTDNTYDIGAAAANRPRSGYFASTVGANGSTVDGNGITLGAAHLIITHDTSGVIRLGNAAANDFNRLQFGGTTSSFPSLKRNASAIDVRLADDSGPATLNAASPFTTYVGNSLAVRLSHATGSGGNIGFADLVGGSADTILTRDGAANIVAIRNSTNAQTFRVYGSYTDSSNYWAGELKASGSNIVLGFKHAGTGTSAINAVEIAGYNQVLLSTGGSNRWWLNSASVFGPTADNLYDLGVSAGRIKTGYFGTAVSTPKVSFSETVTPTGTADVQGSAGDMRYDDSYIYIRTSIGWKRAALSTF